MKYYLLIILQFGYLLLHAQTEIEQEAGENMGNAGWMELRRGSYDSCIATSGAALTHDSTLNYVRFNRALAYALKGDSRVGKAAYAAAIEEAARFGFRAKTYEDAIADLREYRLKLPAGSFTDEIIQAILQAKDRNSKTRTIFMRVNARQPAQDTMRRGHRMMTSVKVAFRDKAGTVIWTSDRIQNDKFDQDSLFCYFKLTVPEQVLSTGGVQSTQYYYHTQLPNAGGAQRIRYAYSSELAGTDYANIKLNIISTPDKASVFLVPHGIWLLNFEGKDWKKFPEGVMDKYRVDSGLTNTSTNIDETVYVIVFKLGDRYLVQTHYTKPVRIQPVQTVNITF